jgi:hypothetical protein
MPRIEVYKLQRPIVTNDPEPKMFCYNQSRSSTFELPITDELNALFDRNPQVIAHFKTYVFASIKGTTLNILGKAPWQTW